MNRNALAALAEAAAAVLGLIGVVGMIGVVIFGLSLIPTSFWDRIDGVSPAGSEATDAAPVVESPRAPAAGAVSLPDPVQEELALDCDPQEVAAAIAEARVYRESMAGRTAGGQSALSPLTYRTLHAVAAGALEAHIARCLRFWEEQ